TFEIGYGLFASGHSIIFNQTNSAFNPAYIFRGTINSIPSIQIQRYSNDSNYERIFFGYNGATSRWILNIDGTSVTHPFEIRMGTNALLTFNTDNTVNANSRTWNNFVASEITLTNQG